MDDYQGGNQDGYQDRKDDVDGYQGGNQDEY